MENSEHSGSNWLKLQTQALAAHIGDILGDDAQAEITPAPEDVAKLEAEPMAKVAKMKLVRGLPVANMPEFNSGPPIDEGMPGLSLEAFVSVFNEGIGDEKDARHVSVKTEDYWEHMFKQDDWSASTH